MGVGGEEEGDVAASPAGVGSPLSAGAIHIDGDAEK